MSIYQHFRPEEKEFIDQALNWIEQVKDSYAPKLTDFLDPRQQQIIASLLGHDDEVKIEFFGGAMRRAQAGFAISRLLFAGTKRFSTMFI